MFRAKALFFLAALTATAQVTSIPAAAGGGGGGATAISGLTDLKVSRNSSTELAIATGKARQGATTTAYSAATATLSGTVATSTAYVYITSSGVLTVGHNGAATVTCSGCTTATGISAFPADAIPLATATYTSSTWDVSGITDLRAIPARENLAAGDGITLSFGASGVTAATDSATVPTYSTGTGAPSAACTQGRALYLDTTTKNLYQCSATNTWLLVAGTAVFYSAVVSDICNVDNVTPTVLYNFPANTLAADDMVEIEMYYQKSATTSAPSVSIFIEATNVSGANVMGTTAADGWAYNTANARIVSSSAASVIGRRQRSNGSVGGTRTSSMTIDTTSSTGFTVSALGANCSGETVETRTIIRVTKNASR